MFGRKVWNSTNELLRRKVLRCNKKYEIKGKIGCNNKHIDDRVLYQVFINTYNTIVNNKDYFTSAYEINGNNYFKLRDIANLFDFSVTWHESTKTIFIDTNVGDL